MDIYTRVEALVEESLIDPIHNRDKLVGAKYLL